MTCSKSAPSIKNVDSSGIGAVSVVILRPLNDPRPVSKTPVSTPVECHPLLQNPAKGASKPPPSPSHGPARPSVAAARKSLKEPAVIACPPKDCGETSP